MRKRDRIRSFWDEVGQALGLDDARVQAKGRFSQWRGDVVTHLAGMLGGFAVEAGVRHSGGEGDANFTYASVTVDGLPPGFTVGPWLATQPLGLVGPRRYWIICVEDGGREVGARRGETVRVEQGGLVTEYETEGFDLDSFLTPRRRQVICSLAGVLVLEGAHQLRTTMPGLPYPRKRDVSRAERGDMEATQSLWASRDRIVELIRATLREAEVITLELSADDSP